VQGDTLRVFSQQTRHGAGIRRSHSTNLPSRVLRSLWREARQSGPAVIAPAIKGTLEGLRCPEVREVLRVRAVSSLFLEEVINSSRHKLQMLHLASRHRSSLAESSDSVSPEVIKSI